MDTLRVFNSGTMNYVPSKVEGTSALRRFYLILNHGFKFAFSSIVECFTFAFSCRWRPKNIEGHVVVVTGGANGIGRETCLRLAREKCRIALVDINLEEAERTVKDLRQLGAEAKAYQADVSDYDAMVKVREQILSDFSKIDILINNAGLVALLTLTRATREQIEKMLAVNVTAIMLITKLFLDDMVTQGSGHIVAISSAFSLAPGSTTVDGVATFAIRGFLDSLRQEILVNDWQDIIKTTCVHPYYTATRKELTDYLESINVVEHMFLLNPTWVADTIVDAIKWEKVNITIPSGFYLLMMFMGNQPSTVIRRFYRMAFGRSSNFP